jgi:ribosomal protein S6--L-glutamate ligase
MARPRIAFLLQRSAPDASPGRRQPSLSHVTEAILGRLLDRGAELDLLVPEDEPLEPGLLRVEYDLYVLKAKTPLTLGLAGAVEAMGARVVNTFAACNLTRDKVATTAVLAAAGVPVPASWVTGQAQRLRQLVQDGPLWLKPPRGSQGVGVQRLASVGELDAAGTLEVDPFGLPLPLFAQREVPSAGCDLKVYVVGDQMWAIARPFPARTLQEKLGTPAHIAPPIREAAEACGQALGLELYGVDVLVAGDQFFVVDVNAFPGYKGVPAAAGATATYLYGQALAALA